MSVNDATNADGALSNEDGAQNIETSKKSKKKCRLLCKPSELPQSPIPQPNLPSEQEMSTETKYRIRDYFWDKYSKGVKRARERRWIK